MDSILRARLSELANRAYNNTQYTFTNFLSEAELSEYIEMSKELAFIPSGTFGGMDASERQIIRFGGKDIFGYEEPFPIVCLKIVPLNEKFADNLNHRDFLGALMNLGIERETIGDILVEDKHAYLFCLESISQYIIENLTRVKHTVVKAEVVTEKVNEIEIKKTEKTIQVSSERVDAVVARVFNISREACVILFKEQKVFINGRLTTGNATKVKEGDRISVRGFGKFDLKGQIGVSKKGKLNLTVSVYG